VGFGLKPHVQCMYESPIVYECLSVSACNSSGSLGETSRAALQWSGRNFMAPVSGCPWWCLICITR